MPVSRSPKPRIFWGMHRVALRASLDRQYLALVDSSHAAPVRPPDFLLWFLTELASQNKRVLNAFCRGRVECHGIVNVIGRSGCVRNLVYVDLHGI